MRVRRGGGGVDKNGITYTLPEEEIEVPDDYFRSMVREMASWKPPEFIVVNPEIFEQMKKSSKVPR